MLLLAHSKSDIGLLGMYQARIAISRHHVNLFSSGSSLPYCYQLSVLSLKFATLEILSLGNSLVTVLIRFALMRHPGHYGPCCDQHGERCA